MDGKVNDQVDISRNASVIEPSECLIDSSNEGLELIIASGH